LRITELTIQSIKAFVKVASMDKFGAWRFRSCFRPRRFARRQIFGMQLPGEGLFVTTARVMTN
jgi:hypothetical protein